MVRLLISFWVGVLAVLALGAAYQLSPVDTEQNAHLATHDAQIATLNAWSFGATQEAATLPFTRTPTFAPGTNTHTPTRTSTPALPSATFVPTLSAPTFTAVPLVTPSPTNLPPMVRAGNVSGLKLRVRACPSVDCEHLAWVYPGETISVNRAVTIIDGNIEWVAMWNHDERVIGGYVAMRQISPPIRYLAFRPQ